MKRDKFDAVFSDLVRERADWTCEACGKYFPEGSRQGLHCSHYVGRANKATRWYGANAFAHCYGCHSRFEGRPGEFYRWVCDRIGQVMEEAITERGRSVRKWKPWEKDELYSHMKEQLSILRARRAAGETGRLEFTDYE